MTAWLKDSILFPVHYLVYFHNFLGFSFHTGLRWTFKVSLTQKPSHSDLTCLPHSFLRLVDKSVNLRLKGHYGTKKDT